MRRNPKYLKMSEHKILRSGGAVVLSAYFCASEVAGSIPAPVIVELL